VRLGLRDPAEVEAEFAGEVDGLGDVLERYRSSLAQRRQLDFDEQIVAAIEVLLAEPQTRMAAQAACRVLLVDEFQDLTPAHVLLIRLLSAPDLAVFGVGDDDQTIYGYTGASPDWLIRYAELFPGAGSHALEVNYRCPPAVVAGADRLLRHNRRRIHKVIRARPAPPAAATPSRVQEPSRSSSSGEPGGGDHALPVPASPTGGGPEGLIVVEAGGGAVAATAEAVAAALAGGAAPAHVAVLTRVNASLAPVQVALAHQGIPVRPVVDAGWLERTGVRAALGWLRLAVEPTRLRAGDVSDTARRPGRGLSARVVEWMAEQRDLDGLTRLSSRLRDRDGEKVAAYAADLQLLAGLVASGSTSASLLSAVRDRIGLDEAMDLLDGSQRSVKGSAQGDDLDALVALAALHPDAATFGAWLREQLARPGDADGVLLSTVHAVKGREWPHVVVHEASDGLFPHRLADDGEEERRVFHVAITRAARSATVVCGAAPSPFVAELSSEAPAFPPAAPDTGARRPGGRSAGPSTATPVGGRPRRRARDQADAASAPVPLGAEAEALLRALRGWRTERARRDGMPAYIVFPDATLEQIVARLPRTMVRLAQVRGVGPTKLDRYGDEVLAVLDEVLGPA
jgi:ATP-dependent DNA helicase UvrD/PcrA